jgi:very-short-patch-repair endonuclease
MTKQRARELRQTMTTPELILWRALRQGLTGFKFRRQVPIGRYIADFVCEQRRLIVELDGSQHVDSSWDRQRDQWLSEQGYMVLRFWNQEVYKNLLGVLEDIGEKACRRPVFNSRRAVWAMGDVVWGKTEL